MEKEKVLEIEIKKINDKYSVFYPTKLNIKELEKIGYTVTEFNLLDEVEKSAINFYFNNKNDFTILLNDTSLNVPFIIENIYIRELKRIVDGYNEKYGIPKRWKPQLKENFFIIERVRTEVSFKWVVTDLVYENDHWIDVYAVNSGNCFKTYEEAEKVVLKLEESEKSFWAKVRAGEIGGENENRE